MTEDTEIAQPALAAIPPEGTLVAGAEKPAFRGRRRPILDEDGADKDFDRYQAVINGKKAAFRNAAEDEPAARVTNIDKPGFTALSPKVPTNDADTKLRGPGWIYCGKDEKGRGTWIKDCGDEIYIPHNRFDGMSAGQKMMVSKLIRQKGWEEVGVFGSDGFSFHQRAAHQLASAGVPCEIERKFFMPSLWRARTNAQELYAHRQSLAVPPSPAVQ